MLEILTLLHGLLIGPLEIEMAPPPETARLEIRLDGELVGERSEPPWSVLLPGAAPPLPKELNVTAFDADGKRLARVNRPLNLDLRGCASLGPKQVPPQEVTPFLIELLPDSAEPELDDLQQRFLLGTQPLEALSLTRGPVEVIVVKDPEMQDVFNRATVAYVNRRAGLTPSRSERDEANQELLVAAEALVRQSGNGLPQGSSSHQASSSDASQSLVVPQQAALQLAFERWLRFASFDVDGHLRFMWPDGPPVARLDRATEVLPLIGSTEASDAGWLWQLRQAAAVERPKRFADAVAVAGFQAAMSCRRRVVIAFESVFLGRDSSQLKASAVMDYLRAVQVPLFVLRDLPLDGSSAPVAATSSDRWGSASVIQTSGEDLRSPSAAEIEVFQRRVEDHLERQRVVWLAGRHLPHKIRMSDGCAGFVAVGSSPTPPSCARRDSP